EVYGDVHEGRATEDRDCAPITHSGPQTSGHEWSGEFASALSPYNVSRIRAEEALFKFAAGHGLPTAALRLFNVLGPQATQKYFVREMISQIVAGGEIRHGTRGRERDFVWIGDTVRAFISAAKLTLQPHEPLPINIASGTTHTMENVLDKLQAMAQR